MIRSNFRLPKFYNNAIAEYYYMYKIFWIEYWKSFFLNFDYKRKKWNDEFLTLLFL